MELLETLWKEIWLFFGLEGLINFIKEGDYSDFKTYEGITSILVPVVPLLVVVELLAGIIHKKPQTRVYQTNFLIYVLNRVIGRFVAIGVVGFMIAHVQQYAPFQTHFTWYWFIYGYIVWEFSHFIYHYFGHKVRLFWCFHSTHHTPEDMNLSVTYAHFFLEGAYADTIRAGICILAGIEPAMLFTIMFIDGFWGALIHLGENVIKDARLGFLGKFILTPSHHRVHHARNPLYMDTNFCNLLNIWDRVFKTYQEEDLSVPIEYGITRRINSANLYDVYFSEFVELAKDVWNAPGIKNKILYLFMPPGWSHTGHHKTAKVVKEIYAVQQSQGFVGESLPMN